MGEPWLREIDGTWLQAPQPLGVYSLNISDLLLPNSKSWDVEKVASLFAEQEVNRILAVPLVPMVEHDKLIWQGERNGLYKVRSGYRRLMAEKRYMEEVSEGDRWTKLWKMQAPPKVKHLLWRILKECLPTRTRLRSRNVQCSVECPLCGMVEEDEWHLFLECEGVIDAWPAAGLNTLLPHRAYNNHNICSFLFDTCRHITTDTLGRLAVLLWCIWLNRNDAVWNSHKTSAQQIGFRAKHMWSEWAVVNEITSMQQSHGQQRTNNDNVQWQQPPPGVVKCNVDASFFVAAPATGWGWCVRDHNGNFLLAGTDFLQANLTTLEGETMALLEAMKNMVQRGYSNVIFESDSKLMVDAITSSKHGISEFCILISHVKSLLLSNPNFEVKFVRRQANMAAHLLARVAYSMASCQVYDFIPLCITTTLINDMS